MKNGFIKRIQNEENHILIQNSPDYFNGMRICWKILKSEIDRQK